MTDLVDRLRELVGDAHVITGPDLAPFLLDARGTVTGDALALVRPADTSQVAAVLRALAGTGVAVVPQGGRTGMSGGAVPFDDRPTVVVSTARLSEIRGVDSVGHTITVGAGVTIEAVQDAARDRRLDFAPDWGARGSATVGGAIATDAGGVNVLRHGTVRDHVLGLEVVLADGRVWDWLRGLRKDSSGLDPSHLFIGTEGTLGIVTAAVLRLGPQRRHVTSALAALPRLALLDEMVGRARAAGAELTACELMPGSGIDLVCERFGLTHPLATDAEWYVLVRYAGTTPVDDALADFLERAAADGVITDAVVGATADQEARLWQLRDLLSPPNLFGPGVDSAKADAAVPLGAVTAFVDGVHDVAGRLAPGSTVLCFGHAGDGNIHAHVLAAADDPTWPDRRVELDTALDELTWSLGGTISAEHGVGRVLVDRIGSQKSTVEVDLARAVKHALDPDGMLNPGKTLPDAPT